MFETCVRRPFLHATHHFLRVMRRILLAMLLLSLDVTRATAGMCVRQRQGTLGTHFLQARYATSATRLLCATPVTSGTRRRCATPATSAMRLHCVIIAMLLPFVTLVTSVTRPRFVMCAIYVPNPRRQCHRSFIALRR